MLIAVLFSQRGHAAADADAIRAHPDRIQFVFLIEIFQIHCLGIFRSQFKRISDFNAFFKDDFAAADRAGVAFHDLPDIRRVIRFEIFLIDMDIVISRLVGAGDEIRHMRNFQIHD